MCALAKVDKSQEKGQVADRGEEATKAKEFDLASNLNLVD
jgi:hypothetical protein